MVLPVATPKSGVQSAPLIINPGCQGQLLFFLSTHSHWVRSSVLLSPSRLLSASFKAIFSCRSQAQCKGPVSAYRGWNALFQNCLNSQPYWSRFTTSTYFIHLLSWKWRLPCWFTERRSLGRCSDTNHDCSHKLLHSCRHPKACCFAACELAFGGRI